MGIRLTQNREQKEEYDKEYFLSGEVDLSLYEDDCVFADPFARSCASAPELASEGYYSSGRVCLTS
jgi:hypothetical protein